jgi:hypothetical protein
MGSRRITIARVLSTKRSQQWRASSSKNTGRSDVRLSKNETPIDVPQDLHEMVLQVTRDLWRGREEEHAWLNNNNNNTTGAGESTIMEGEAKLPSDIPFFRPSKIF